MLLSKGHKGDSHNLRKKQIFLKAVLSLEMASMKECSQADTFHIMMRILTSETHTSLISKATLAIFHQVSLALFGKNNSESSF